MPAAAAIQTLPPVPEEAAGQRLDRWLAAGLGGTATPGDDDPSALSRSRLKALVLDGRVTLAGETIADPSRKIKPGEVYSLAVPEAVAAEPAAQDIPLQVVFEDDQLIVVDKPAGLVVHPAPGNPQHTLVNALLHHCGDSLSGIGGVKRPGIVHRIDKDTSGLVVAAKTDAAHRGLSALFAAHDIERSYLALVWGHPAPAAGSIEGAIGRDPRDRKRMALVTRNGKPATTHYRTEALVFDDRGRPVCALLRCRLETGRTHQIRVHLTSRGHPLVGDATYGRSRAKKAIDLPAAAKAALAGFPRQALHAATLGFRHPGDGRGLRFESPLPADFAALLAVLGVARKPGAA